MFYFTVNSYKNMACRYRNMFGKPGEGVHSWRLFDFAVVDVGLTVLSAILFNRAFDKNFWLILLIHMLVAIALHRLFCVNTTLNILIFGKV